MSTSTTPARTPDATRGAAQGATRAGVRRVGAVARANATLMARNRMTLLYALGFPLVPLVLGVPDDVPTATARTLDVLLLAWLFPVFYNLLSMVVTRRDELVLKRMRTGETRDAELLLGMALPGWVVTLASGAVALAVVAATAGALPAMPLVLALAALAGCVVFTGLALWTASWTRNAEAAQITSLPVLLVAMAGGFGALMPEPWRTAADYTPTGALRDLVELGWTGSGELLLPMVVLAAWVALSLLVAHRSMRWEPRT